MKNIPKEKFVNYRYFVVPVLDIADVDRVKRLYSIPNVVRLVTMLDYNYLTLLIFSDSRGLLNK